MVWFDMPLGAMLTFLFALGSVLGSFLNVCIHRIPQKAGFWDSLRSLVHPPSRCPNCFHRIQSYDNIPIVGWLLLRGRCRHCRIPISWRYPAIELGNGLLFVLLYWFEIPTEYGTGLAGSCLYNGLGPHGFPDSVWLSPVAALHWRYLYHLVLVELLVAATFIDFDLKIIPDGVTLPAMAAGVLGGLACGQVYIVPLWFQRRDLGPLVGSVLSAYGLPVPAAWLHAPAGVGAGTLWVPAWFAQYPHLHGLFVSLAGIVVGGGLIWGVRLIGNWVLRQEAMGFGDVVLLAAIGSFLGWQPTVLVFLLAPACALVIVAMGWIFWRQREIPYGPYLSVATLLVILAWKPIWSVAQHIFELGPILPVLAVVMAGLLALSLLIVQGAKRLLGFELYPSGWIEEWTPGDQLAHFAGEKGDPRQGQWPHDEWRGMRTSTGRMYLQDWRRGPERHAAASWQAWQRRNHKLG